MCHNTPPMTTTTSASSEQEISSSTNETMYESTDAMSEWSTTSTGMMPTLTNSYISSTSFESIKTTATDSTVTSYGLLSTPSAFTTTETRVKTDTMTSSDTITTGGADPVLIICGVMGLILLIALMVTVGFLIKTRSILLKERNRTASAIERGNCDGEEPQHDDSKENPCYDSLGEWEADETPNNMNYDTTTRNISTTANALSKTTVPLSPKSYEEVQECFQKPHKTHAVENPYNNTTPKHVTNQTFNKATTPSHARTYEDVDDVRQEYHQTREIASSYDEMYSHLDGRDDDTIPVSVKNSNRAAFNVADSDCGDDKGAEAQTTRGFVLYDEVDDGDYSHLEKRNESG